MEALEATPISNSDEPLKAALRNGPIVIVALRLDPGRWEPLYAIYGCRRVALTSSFRWTHAAIGTLEMVVPPS